MTARILLVLALAVTALAYWTGLDGPFLLDDMENFKPIEQWLAGELGWRSVVFGNESGPLGRPLAMATFLGNAAMTGYAPFWFKAVNLGLHLAIGVLGWQLLRRVLRSDPAFAPHADLTASLLAALWLLHPLHASTVLYAVQRMAQLSTLFVLAALCVYLWARDRIEAGATTRGRFGLFLLFPLLLAAGLFSKENAAVAPALCLVLEWACYRGRARPRAVTGFFVLFLALPLVAVSAMLVLAPDTLLAGYRMRDFTLGERLLSQGRALMHYLAALVFPQGPSLGVFTDDFLPSRGLLSPATTLWSWLALLGITAAAVVVRRRAPLLLAGWLFFLVAHAVESGFLPLELYFEHRNYLPSFGVLLALAGLAGMLRGIPTDVLSPRTLGIAAAAGFIFTFAFVTHGRARAWQHEDVLVEQALRAHPLSLRANLAQATIALRQGRPDGAYAALARLLTSSNPRHRALAHIHWVSMDCLMRRGANPADLRQAVALMPPRVTLAEVQAFELLARIEHEQRCQAARPIADTIVQILEKSAPNQPARLQPQWRLRYTAAQLHARAGDWGRAAHHAQQAWVPGADAPVGALLVTAYAKLGRRDAAVRVLQEVERRILNDDQAARDEVERLRKMLQTGTTRAQHIRRNKLLAINAKPAPASFARLSVPAS